MSCQHVAPATFSPASCRCAGASRLTRKDRYQQIGMGEVGPRSTRMPSTSVASPPPVTRGTGGPRRHGRRNWRLLCRPALRPTGDGDSDTWASRPLKNSFVHGTFPNPSGIRAESNRERCSLFDSLLVVSRSDSPLACDREWRGPFLERTHLYRRRAKTLHVGASRRNRSEGQNS